MMLWASLPAMAAVERLEADATLVDDMRLPEGEELEYLLDGLGNLIRRRGVEPFLSCAGAYFGAMPALAFGVVGLVFGVWRTSRESRFACSSCGTEVFPDKDWCAGCDGPVRWD